MSPNNPPIRLRADGSIDTGHYMEIGRRMRSQHAHRMMENAPLGRFLPRYRR